MKELAPVGRTEKGVDRRLGRCLHATREGCSGLSARVFFLARLCARERSHVRSCESPPLPTG